MPRTAFDPAHHGFGSANRSQSQRFIGPIHFSVGGRCGGVVDAAPDHLLGALPIPSDTALPAKLGTFVSQRQDKSITNSLDLCRRADAELASSTAPRSATRTPATRHIADRPRRCHPCRHPPGAPEAAATPSTNDEDPS